MIGSGRVVLPENNTAKIPGRNFTLSHCELKLLEEAYMDLISRLALLCVEYNKALMRAANAREISIFPTRANWTPPPPLREDSAEYLSGPSAEILLLERKSIIDSHTCRSIVFSSSKLSSHSSSRHSSSFVHLPDGSLAQIKWQFTHTFVDETFDMTLLQVFKNPVKTLTLTCTI